MGHHHVAVGAGLVVEAGATVDPECLWNIDLHVFDVVAVPDRLKETIGETQREDVLSRFFAEEMVDPEDLRLVEYLMRRCIELLGAREVGPERLLHHYPSAFGKPC